MAAVASSPASEDMASRSVISPEELSKLLDVIQVREGSAAGVLGKLCSDAVV